MHTPEATLQADAGYLTRNKVRETDPLPLLLLPTTPPSPNKGILGPRNASHPKTSPDPSHHAAILQRLPAECPQTAGTVTVAQGPHHLPPRDAGDLGAIWMDTHSQMQVSCLRAPGALEKEVGPERKQGPR